MRKKFRLGSLKGRDHTEDLGVKWILGGEGVNLIHVAQDTNQ
jgi:hypothetical protein